jgi:hypothetical protein
MLPDTSVPVTTVPKPCSTNERSIGRRATPPAGRSGTVSKSFPSSSRSASRPAPVRDDTGTTAARSRNDPARNSLVSRETTSRTSASTRSDFVRTTRP